MKDARQKFYEEVEKGEMGPVVIDYYHYCNDEDRPKEKFYLEYEPNKLEKEKTDEFRKRLIEFVIQVQGEDQVKYLPEFLEGQIKYKENFGYITVINPDRDIEDIYFYGEDEDTAFIHAIVSYMFRCGDYHEYENRQELAHEFETRFPDDVNENHYYGNFFFLEYALSNLNIYFNYNIPEEIKAYYESYLDPKFMFDYEKNHMVKRVPNMEPKLTNPDDK